MSATLPVGPYKTIAAGDDTAPWYIMPFDKYGTCTAPLTRRHLIDTIRGGRFTDLFLFSHGWNNDWENATERYEEFISGFRGMRIQHALRYPREVRAALLGVIWPSTALVMPWEQPPRFAAAAADVPRPHQGLPEEIQDLGTDMDRSMKVEFDALAQSQGLTNAEAERLAEIMAHTAGQYAREDAEYAGLPVASPTADQLLEGAQQLQPSKVTLPRRPGELDFRGSRSFSSASLPHGLTRPPCPDPYSEQCSRDEGPRR